MDGLIQLGKQAYQIPVSVYDVGFLVFHQEHWGSFMLGSRVANGVFKSLLEN